jgi:hypothetical protein
MNDFVLFSAAMGPACLFGVYLVRKTNSWHDFTHLSEEVKDYITIASNMRQPEKVFQPYLSFFDVVAIYLTSRGNRSWANRKRLDSGCQDSKILLSFLEEHHTSVKRLACACLADKAVGKIVPQCASTYSQTLLWTFAGEQEALSQMEPYCTGEDLEFIKTRT